MCKMSNIAKIKKNLSTIDFAPKWLKDLCSLNTI